MRITHWVLVGALALGGALLWDYTRLRGEITTARQEAKTAREAEQKVRTVVVYRERLRVATAAVAASQAASVSAAVEANPEWANRPVPQEVQDALAP